VYAAGAVSGISAILKFVTFLFGAPELGITAGTAAGWAGGGSSLERGTFIQYRSIPTLIHTSHPE
jgi:hypothetical protein